jgi:hypothetical protein
MARQTRHHPHFDARAKPGWLLAGLLSASVAASSACRPPPAPPPLLPPPPIELPEDLDDHLRFEVRWRALELSFDTEEHLSGTARVVAPDVRLFLPAPPAEQVLELPSFPEALEELLPAEVERIDVRRGEVRIIDTSQQHRPTIWLHELEVAIENLATRERLMMGRPTLLTARAMVQRTGVLTVFVSADPFGRGLNFSGRAAVRGLALREVSPFVKEATGLRIVSGELDLFIAFISEEGRIRGGVKPLLRGVQVEAAEGGPFARLRAGTIDLLFRLFSNRVPGRRAVATVIPIEGELLDPEVQVWPAVLGILYNAFVTGMSASFAGLPPPRAGERRGPIREGWRVLVGGRRPQAQPPADRGEPEEEREREEDREEDREQDREQDREEDRQEDDADEAEDRDVGDGER